MESTNDIGLLQYILRYNTEEKCITDMVEKRHKEGIICSTCNCKTKHYYIKSIKQFRCSQCKTKKGLRQGTYMKFSKLPVQYWYICTYLMTESVKPISANQMKKYLGHKFYEPIFDMMHVIRVTMGQRDRLYMLNHGIEVDDCQVRTYKSTSEKKDAPKLLFKKDNLKRGKGSQRTSKVLVAVESQYTMNDNKHKPNKSVDFIRMESILTTKSNEINFALSNMINGQNAVVTSDMWKGNLRIDQVAAAHLPVNTNKPTKEKIIANHLPWVHKVISNFKRQVLGTHHAISNKYLDNYLAEFQYKFNRRRIPTGEKVNRLIEAGMNMSWAA